MRPLLRALAVRPGEGRLVGLVGAAFAAVEAGRGFGEVAVNTLVPSADLPSLFVALGLVGLVLTLAYGAALGRIRGDRLFPAILVGVAAVLVVERIVLAVGGRAAVAPLWVSVFAAGALLATVLWTIAGRVLDARQAKRLFPLLTSAAILGGFVGLLVAGPAARLLGTETLILGQALLLTAAAVALTRVGSRLRAPTQGRAAPPSALASLRTGAEHVARSPLMRLVAVAYLLFAVLLFSVLQPFLGAMATAFPDEADRATALGLLSAAVTGTSFLLATLVANRLFAAVGVASVALALPVVYLVGFGTWFVSYTLVTAVAFRFAQEVTQRGLSNAAWSAMFGVVPGARRGQVLAFIDGVPGQLGTVLSGVLLLAATALATQQVFLLGLLTAAACLVVVLRIRRLYAASLVATLREGLAEQVLEGGPGLVALTRDPRVHADLRRALRSERAAERRLAVEVLGEAAVHEALPDIAALLADDDAEVRRSAVEALDRLGDEQARRAAATAVDDPDAGVRAAAVAAAASLAPGLDALPQPTVLRLVDDPSAAVRAEAAVALCRSSALADGVAIIDRLLASSSPADRIAGLGAVTRLEGRVPLDTIARSLTDTDAAVRAAAVSALAAWPDDVAATDALLEALDDEARPVREAAARTIATRPEVPARLLGLLAGGGERMQDAALAALDGKGDLVRDELVSWAVGQVGRAATLRRRAADLEASVASAGSDDPTRDGTLGDEASFLAALLRRRGSAIEARLLRVLAILGSPEATGPIRRSLASHDSETRAQAIEALDALGDRRLARAVVDLLDSEPERVAPEPGAPLAVARALVDDPDPWVRALALRTLSAYLEDERRWVADRVGRDGDPIVRAAVGIVLGGAEVPESRPTLGDVDRMLLLRRVPLFATLAPEDLQRVAMTASERRYAGEEVIVREGELGDELVVIVEGSVRIVHLEEAGERLLARYEAGDHFGELAVIRERPRAATVIAEEPGVRGLVIGGEGLKAILRERPEAAMAMLATLAERLGTQVGPR